jgi:glycosyltransferase involved in cell wall biosynthesis
LKAQTLNDRLEVLVVDDGSDDSRAVASVVAENPQARLLRRDGRGPAAARNAGIRAARGTYICFTDDDCEPRVDWVERLVATLRGGADAVGGRTVGGTTSALVRASELVSHAPAFVPTRPDLLPFAPSNNLACLADALADVPFDERYGTAAGEDREWCARLLRTGRSLRFEPSAVVIHHQELDLWSFLRQQTRYGRGAFMFRRLGDEPSALEPPAFYADLMRRGFAEGFLAGSFVCLAQLAAATGFSAEWLKTRRSG